MRVWKGRGRGARGRHESQNPKYPNPCLGENQSVRQRHKGGEAVTVKAGRLESGGLGLATGAGQGRRLGLPRSFALQVEE